MTETCQLDTLADEMRRFVSLHLAVDDLQTQAAKKEEEARLDAMKATVEHFWEGAKDRATYLQAKSQKGALLQLALLQSFVEDLAGQLTQSQRLDWRIREMEDAIERLIYSLVDYIESTSDARLEDSGATFFLPRDLNPFSKLNEAAAKVAETKETHAV